MQWQTPPRDDPSGLFLGIAAVITAITGGLAAILRVFSKRDKSPPPAPPEEQARPGSVMVVDDRPDVVASVIMVLEEEGYQVEGFTSAQEALIELAQCSRGRKPFDVMFLDLSMPGMGGQEAAHRALLIDPRLSIVILSGHGKAAAILEMGRLGVANYLTKPIDAEQLQRAARSGVTLSRTKRKL